MPIKERHAGNEIFGRERRRIHSFRHHFAAPPARWVVLLPGAEQQSTTCVPGCGCSACAAMQLDRLCGVQQRQHVGR